VIAATPIITRLTTISSVGYSGSSALFGIGLLAASATSETAQKKKLRRREDRIRMGNTLMGFSS
jgi:hypothetical protein